MASASAQNVDMVGAGTPRKALLLAPGDAPDPKRTKGPMGDPETFHTPVDKGKSMLQKMVSFVPRILFRTRAPEPLR